jgi:DNA-directed RNA polymerase subunit omega
MARVTIEDCLSTVDNMYDLVLVATHRVRQIYKGSETTVKCKNRAIVTSLREIAAGHFSKKDIVTAGDDEMPN